MCKCDSKIIGVSIYIGSSGFGDNYENAVVFEDCVFYSDPNEHAEWLKTSDGMAWLERTRARREGKC